MSKLIDKFCEMSKITPQPMGFRTARAAAAKPRPLLVICYSEAETIEKLLDATSGADAVLLSKIGGVRSMTKIGQALKDIPWGVSLPDTGRKDLKPTIDAGCDFVTFTTDSMAVSVPQDEDDTNKLGRILQLESGFDVNLLRVVNEMPVDAVYIADELKADFFTWHYEMLLERLGLIVAKPLLIRIPETVNEDELRLLWEVGMDGLVVECGTQLEKLRRSIDGLSLPARKRRRAEALVPFVRETPEPEIEEEEEEEGE